MTESDLRKRQADREEAISDSDVEARARSAVRIAVQGCWDSAGYFENERKREVYRREVERWIPRE